MAKRKMREIWIYFDSVGNILAYTTRPQPHIAGEYVRFVESPAKKARKKR